MPQPSARTLNIAERCERIGKMSAQSCVYKLPEEFSADVSPTDRFDDTVRMDRVLKIHLPLMLVQAAVESVMQFTDTEATMAKMSYLQYIGHKNYKMLWVSLRRDPDLARLFAYPRFILTSINDMYPHTQDLCDPIPSAIDKLDIEHHPERAKTAFEWIDNIIDTNTTFLPRRGLFDGIMKPDNWARSPKLDGRFATDYDRPYLDRGRLIDPFELMHNREEVIARVEQKFWRDNVSKPPNEYSPLPLAVAEYFVEECDERITPDIIRQNWLPSPLPYQPGLARRHDIIHTDFPADLCHLLAQKNLDVYNQTF